MRIPLLFFFSFFLQLSTAQTGRELSLFDTLYLKDKVAINITYPFDSLYKTQNDKVDATVTIQTNDGILMDDAPLELSLRGKFRRMKCTMPPLMLNFKKPTLKQLGLSGVDEIKMVTHCIEGVEGHSNLEEERLIYQLYEAVTPYSYRTIWVQVRYCDTYDASRCYNSVAFLLEPDKVISQRLNMEERKLFNIAEDSITFESFSTASAFNFLIGNRDWSIVASRNAKLFYSPGLGKYVVIPYDFDYSNIVGASYRRDHLPKSMTHPFDRIYEGEYFATRAGEILKSFYIHYKPITNAIEHAVNPIDPDRRKRIMKYINSWFDMVRKSKPEELKYGTVCPYEGGL